MNAVSAIDQEHRLLVEWVAASHAHKMHNTSGNLQTYAKKSENLQNKAKICKIEVLKSAKNSQTCKVRKSSEICSRKILREEICDCNCIRLSEGSELDPDPVNPDSQLWYYVTDSIFDRKHNISCRIV